MILYFNSQFLGSKLTETIINPITKDFAYSLYDKDNGVYRKRSAFSIIKIKTNASDLKIKFFSPIADLGDIAGGVISIFDENWKNVAIITPEDTPDEQLKTVKLSGSGLRIFYISEGGNTQDGATDFRGSHITSIESIQGYLSILPINKAINRIVTVGDSISIGGNTPQYSKYAWTVRLRYAKRNQWSLTTDGWGAAYTLGIFGNDSLQQEGANRVVKELNGATGRKIFIWALGTNDYGYVVGDPVLVGQAASSVWDKINEKDGDVEIICISPLIRNNENNPNSGGWILNDYRNALQIEANARPFVTFINGESILTVGDLVDGVHPGIEGHQKIADYIESIL